MEDIKIPTNAAEAEAILSAQSQKADASWVVKGAPIYVPIEEEDDVEVVFYEAEIVSHNVEAETVTARLSTGKVGTVQEYKIQEIFPANTEVGIEDMVNCTHLHEAALLQNLIQRYEAHDIFTYVGPTLIALNPYEVVPGLTTQETLEMYKQQCLGAITEQLPPHIYSIASNAYSQLWENKKNQAIVISGESGAGKTENTKFAMNFLTNLSNSSDEGMEAKILRCNPILEAFGNAKTVRNDNSSRFGKFVRLFFDKRSKNITGATITNYLLEKSRVVHVPRSERNYHIFYLFCKAAPGTLLTEMGLTKTGKVTLKSFNYMNTSKVFDVKTINDYEWFAEVQEALNICLFSQEEQYVIWKLLSVVLLMGQLDFDDTEYEEDSSFPCTILPDRMAYLHSISRLLQVPEEKIIRAMTVFVRVIGGTEIPSPIAKVDCQNFRDSLAKEIYNKLFNWIVNKLNLTIQPPGKNKNPLSIGLLDIFGFELFKNNSFEQLCINYTNEKLQQLYISYVFKAEVAQFQEEGLREHVGEIIFEDNQPVIDLLEGPPTGIFQIIDDQCSLKTNDAKLLQQIIKQHKTNKSFAIPKMKKTKFIVFHTARHVDYQIEGFRAKNMDEVRKELGECVTQSADPILASVYQLEKDALPQLGKFAKFLGAKFRFQMGQLMDDLRACDCHFIRCIKPNEDKKPWRHLPGLVLLQVQYLGMLDSIKIRRESYPIRKVFKAFYERYNELNPDYNVERYIDIKDTSADWRGLCLKVMQAVFPDIKPKWALNGKTKIFLKTETYGLLEKFKIMVTRKKNNMATKVQSYWKMYKAYNFKQKTIYAFMRLQVMWRIRKERQKFLKMRAASSYIKAWWKGVLMARLFATQKHTAKVLQRYGRAKLTRLRFLAIRGKVGDGQRLIRGFLGRRRFEKLRFVQYIYNQRIFNPAWTIIMRTFQGEAAELIQRRWRGTRMRMKHWPKVIQIRSAKENFVLNRACMKVQPWVKGALVRVKLFRLNQAARYIQGHFKAKWTYALFTKVRIESRRIQRAVRCFLARTKIIRERMANYVDQENAVLDNLCLLEQSELFTTVGPISGDSLRYTFGKSMSSGSPTSEGMRTLTALSEKNASAAMAALRNTGSLAAQAKPVTPFHIDKIQLFSRILDFDMITDISDIYDSMWSKHFENLNKDCINKSEQIMRAQVGGCHSAALTSRGRLFVWGWNDKYQLTAANSSNATKPREVIKDSRILNVSCADDHSLAVDDLGNVWAFGDNLKGQLGQGHYQEVTDVKSVEGIPKRKVKQAQAVGTQNLVLTTQGDVFMWPYENIHGDKNSRPMKLPLKTQITQIAMGFNFGVLVAVGGQCYTFGKACREGQLGHNDYQPRRAPEMVIALRSEKVVAASCGLKHVIARTSLGRVYTWGWNELGQLGHGDFDNKPSPEFVTVLPPPSRAKVIQVSAGWRHSILMTENRRVFWFGTNSELREQCVPTEAMISSKIPELFTTTTEFNVVKVQCSWSRTLSITSLVIADVRTLKQPHLKVQNAINTLANKWEEDSIEPPYIESIAGLFAAINLKAKSPSKSKNRRPNAEQQVKLRMKKLVEMPEDMWTEEDHEFMRKILP